MQQALLIVSHGSRRAESNDEVRRITKQLESLAKHKFDIIQTGFLELAEPSIPEGIEQCIHMGATSVLVLPYFLAAGRHVAEDIPQIIQQLKIKHPDISINIATHLGAADFMPEFLSRLALSELADNP